MARQPPHPEPPPSYSTPSPSLSPSSSPGPPIPIPTETSPLIPQKPSPAPSITASSINASTTLLPLSHPFPSSSFVRKYKPHLSEILILTRTSTPVILAYMLQNSLQTFSILIAGRLSPEALATAAFSFMFAMSTAWLIGLGGTTALDTLASSSFTGSTDKKDLGVLLQRGLMILSAIYGLVAVVWWNSEGLFRWLGQEEYIYVESARFLRLLIPGGLGYVWFEAMKKYLQAQEIYKPGTYVLLLTSPLNIALNLLLVHGGPSGSLLSQLKLGLHGAPLATGISYWASFLLLVAYAYFIRGHECWGGLSPKRALLHGPGLWSFTRLALLGIIHVGTEWWAFEIVALAAGRLGTLSLAAQSVIMTADQIINTIPFGLGVATSSRLGNLLGGKKAKEAERAAHCAAVLSMIAGALILAVLMGTKDVFGRIFNHDERVVRLVAQVMPFVALFQIADGLNGSCGGALRGLGRQWVGAAVNLVSYYCGALPGGIYLASHGWGLAGLWLGQCVALYLVGAFEWVIVGMSDWEVEVKRARARLELGGMGVESDDDEGDESV